MNHGSGAMAKLKASRRGSVPAFIALEVLRDANVRAEAGASVLHLEIGQPSTPAPAAVIEAAKLALDTQQIGYTESLGLPALRRRIARHYRDFYGVEVDPERVVVTTGSSGAFLLGFLAAFDPGNRVALAAPGYPAYRNILLALDLVPVSLRTGPETRFQPTVELLDGLDAPVDGLIVASPGNPTGTMLSGDELERLCDYCRACGIRLVSDEIYHGITYGEQPATAAALWHDAIVVNSFSKYFSMTGWRLGWMIVPEKLLRPVERLAQNLFISPPTLPQHAAIAAFDCRDELDANVRRYARNRELLLAGLPAAGFDRLTPPDGAFYLFADVTRLTNDSREFCRRMLAETGVATTPGVDFDTERGHRYITLLLRRLERRYRGGDSPPDHLALLVGPGEAAVLPTGPAAATSPGAAAWQARAASAPQRAQARRPPVRVAWVPGRAPARWPPLEGWASTPPAAKARPSVRLPLSCRPRRPASPRPPRAASAPRLLPDAARLRLPHRIRP